MLRLLPLLATAAALLSAPAQAGPGMYVGAAEDAAKAGDLVTAKAKMDLAALAGFDAIRLTAIWSPGQTELEGYERDALANAAAAAGLTGIRVVLSVYHRGSRTTPLAREDREDFARFAASLAERFPSIRDVIVGNEPNLNMFWLPQFSRRGVSLSPSRYLRLLAGTYDALKAVSPEITVIGGALSPRGGDDHEAKRQTHSPTRFIRELGRAYRFTGRDRPVMDAFAFHPYGENSSVPPDFERHPRSTSIGLSEYDRLVRALAAAFDGTAQAGATLPIVYDEYGIDTAVPRAKAGAYRGREPRTTKPVGEVRQGLAYRRALAMAVCQPNVAGLLFFHVSDERDLDRWQSGVFYADDEPKASLPIVRRATSDYRAGALVRCSTMRQALRWRNPLAFTNVPPQRAGTGPRRR